MPDLSSIENFKSLINSLGNEETILSKKGLKIENILPGKTAPEEDLGSLFSSPSEEENGLSPRDDFLNELDEIPLEEALEPVEETPEDSFSGSEIFGDDFSFGEEPEDGLSGFDQEDLDAGITEGEEAFGEDGFDAGLGDAGEDFSFEEPGGESEAPETGALGEDPFDAGLGDAGGEDFSFEEPGGENEAPETGAFDEGKEETGEGEDDGGFSFSALGDPDEEPLGETPAPGEEEDFNPLGFSIEEEPGGEKEGEEKVPAEEEKEEAFPAGDGDIFDVADFNLDDDISGQFGLETPSPAGPTQAPPKAAPDREPSGEGPSFGEGGDDLSFSQEDFARITATLDSLPRNLRLIIEEQIGDKGLSGDGLVKILEALKAGESPKQLAALTGKIIGRRIEIPAQYQKFSGLQFEEQRSTFAYAFKHNIWPIMRVVLAALAALGLLSYLVFHFIFTPLYANHLYRRGVTEIRRDEFETGNEYFNQASEKWRIKRWYYTYAEEYAAKLQYVMAEQKYTELLKFYPGDPKGLLDFARLESEKLGKYPQAEALIKERLSQEPYDEEALLLAGDNYIRWGDELDPAMYEEARYHYALLIQRYGQKDPYLFRMLSYLIRTDNYDEVLRFKNAFQANSRAQIDPEIYTDMAGYLMDKGDFNDIAVILERIRKINPNLPQLYFQFGRYYRQINDPVREEASMDAVLGLLAGTNPETRKLLRTLILAHNRKGEMLYSRNMAIDAENQFHRAREIYEEALSINRLSPAAEYGRIYANLGDIYYERAGGDQFSTALLLYQEAQRNFYTTPDLSYRKGYIYNRRENYEQSLFEFYTAASGYSDNANLLYSTAVTLYRRNDYFLSQGYYNSLIDILEQQRASIPYLLIDEQPEHLSLINNLYVAYNNLGAALYRIYLATSDPAKLSQAMMNFSRSVEYYDYMTRNRSTMERGQSRALAYLNLNWLLHPVPGMEPQIHSNLPRDMKAPAFPE